MEVTNRFKGLDLIDRVPKELWTEVCDIVQEAVNKTIPKKKKYNKEKWLSEEALQIAEKRREAKSKEKERYGTENLSIKKMLIKYGSEGKKLVLVERVFVCVYVCSVMCNSLRPHGLLPTRLLCLWISQARILEWVAISYSRGSS